MQLSTTGEEQKWTAKKRSENARKDPFVKCSSVQQMQAALPIHKLLFFLFSYVNSCSSLLSRDQTRVVYALPVHSKPAAWPLHEHIASSAEPTDFKIPARPQIQRFMCATEPRTRWTRFACVPCPWVHKTNKLKSHRWLKRKYYNF